MSGVWREQSVPMTDRECALLALEAIGAVVSNHTETQCSLSIGGRSWTMSIPTAGTPSDTIHEIVEVARHGWTVWAKPMPAKSP